MSDRSRYTAPALEKGLDILELLASRFEPMSQAAIAHALGRTPSEVFRMISVLEQRGYLVRVTRNEEGKAKIKVDAGTQSGKIVRLRGKGLPSVDSYGNGDLLINLNVWTPKSLTKDETQALEALRDSANFQPDLDHEERGFFDKVRDMFS